MPSVYIKTFGCQMNDYDSGKMRAQLAADGFIAADEPGDADLVIVNTCSIRDKPEQKLHSFLGTVLPQKKVRPVTVAIAGCVAQMAGKELYKKYPSVDMVFGPDAVHRIREMVEESKVRRVLDVDFFGEDTYPFPTDVDPGDGGGSVAGFVTIQKGCDNKCTFCVVPSTRGVEVSRPAVEIVDEVQRLCDRGVTEITLIGQNVNSYGLKLGAPGLVGERATQPQPAFAELLRRVHEVEGLELLRYTTSHPRDMGDDVIACYRDLPKLADHLHLPVQSGADRVLRRMKRFYTREVYLDVVARLRAARPSLVLTTDVIVGFPGESDADFEETVTLLEAVRFQGSFSFIFSPRPGTSALRLMDDAIPAGVASARLTRFQAVQRTIQLEEHRGMVGRTVPVLVDGPSAHDEGVACGRTSSFKTVNFPASDDVIRGSWVNVVIGVAYANTLRGTVI
ncbi:MAG: tRNA (N6-isopentenyl adenosine(37)-C2)-methylthiotransferase MiaB [Myxococcales bacterium]|nr:tRNA (N6-isopentenyl adenosine(37)-C2)-methylthiotransferase MiaB [Myxococcales bacterium]